MEEWRDIEGYEGLYKVSSLGRIMSVGRTFRTGKNGTRLCVLSDSIKKTVVNNKGYLRVSLNKNGKLKSFLVHRLVAQAFIPNPDNLPEVNHKNEIKFCNEVSNLEWCTTKYNINYNYNYSIARQKTIENRRKTIIQLSLNNEFIKEWKSVHSAAKELGLSQGNISSCLLGLRNKCGNFKWKYNENKV